MKKTRLVLVEFPWGRDKDPRVPLGHASMLAMVTNLPNVSCKSFVRPINSSNFNIESIKHEILYELTKTGEDADIAFGVYVWCEDVIKSIFSLNTQSKVDRSHMWLHFHYMNIPIMVYMYRVYT